MSRLPSMAVKSSPRLENCLAWSRPDIPVERIRQITFLPGVRIGIGTNSLVTKVVHEGKHLAVKSSFKEQRYSYDNCLYEARIMRNLDHVNIMKIMGFYSDRQQVFIIMPAYEMDLWKHLQCKVVMPETKSRICKGLTEGIGYIHSNNYIHGDLKAANILLDNSLNPIIADFGMATTTDKLEYIHSKCTYLAPELSEFACDTGDSVNAISIASDIFGLGGLILSVMANQAIHAYWRHKSGTSTVELTALYTYKPRGSTPIFENIIIPCMSLDASARPTIDQIKMLLEAIDFANWIPV